MRYLSKPKFEREMNKLKAQNEQLRMRNELLAERNKYRKKPKMEMIVYLYQIGISHIHLIKVNFMMEN